MELFSIALFVGVIAFPIWGGLVLGNLRKTRKATERIAANVEYLAVRDYERALGRE